MTKRPSPVTLRRFALFLLTLAVLGPLGHYYLDVRNARAATPELLADAWQRFGKQLTLSDISPTRLQCLLAVEDPEFFRHRGVDLHTPGAGMTTISQGLVKLLYFPGGFRPGIGKIRQTLIARYAFDAQVPKNEQLELFLNIAYFGHLDGKALHGFSNAARAYFGKDFGALSESEFRTLVAMLAAPERFLPGSAALGERLKHIDAYLSGNYRPASVLDVEYNGKAGGSPGEEGLMIFLRLIAE